MNQLINFARIAKKYFSDASTDDSVTDSEGDYKVSWPKEVMNVADRMEACLYDAIKSGGDFERQVQQKTKNLSRLGSDQWYYTVKPWIHYLIHAENVIANFTKNELVTKYPVEYLLNIYFCHAVFQVLRLNTRTARMNLFKLVTDSSSDEKAIIVCPHGTKVDIFDKDAYERICKAAEFLANPAIKFDERIKIRQQIALIGASFSELFVNRAQLDSEYGDSLADLFETVQWNLIPEIKRRSDTRLADAQAAVE